MAGDEDGRFRLRGVPANMADLPLDEQIYWVQRGVFAPVEESAAQEERTWKARVQRATKNGKRATQYGCALILEHDEAWRGVLALDRFSDDLVKLKPPPWVNAETGAWNDRDTAHAVHWLSEHWGLEPSGAALSGALEVVGTMRQFHPVRDWLEALPEPSTSLLDTWLRDGFGANERDDYTTAVGRAFLISAVARVMEPGCKVDHVLILEGEQGRGKSTGLHALFDRYYSDQPIVFGDKDTYLAIRGVWCLELAELDSWRKAEHTQSKAFFTQRRDRYRPPYGHRMQEVPRQCVFVGTTNQVEYLRDPTGHRRYWPVRCGAVDVDWIREHRESLFAEALQAYRAGELWWLPPESEAMLREVRESRIQEDPWEESIARWTANRTGDFVSTESVLIDALEIDRSNITQQHQTRVAYIMLSLGWRKARKRVGGVPVRGYARPDH